MEQISVKMNEYRYILRWTSTRWKPATTNILSSNTQAPAPEHLNRSITYSQVMKWVGFNLTYRIQLGTHTSVSI